MNTIQTARPTFHLSARAWVDTRPEAAPARSRAPRASTRWARVPLKTASGEAVAVRMAGRDMWVGLRVAGDPRVVWRAAGRVLTEAQAARWVRSGFAP